MTNQILIDKAKLQQVLEALEYSYGYVEEDAENAERLYGNYPTRQARIQGLKDEVRKHWDAIAALRQALEPVVNQQFTTEQQTADEPVDERALIRKVDAEFSAHGLEAYTSVHVTRHRLLTAVRYFLSVSVGHLPDWLLQPAQAMQDASKMSVGEMSKLQTLIEAFGAEKGVRFTDEI